MNSINSTERNASFSQATGIQTAKDIYHRTETLTIPASITNEEPRRYQIPAILRSVPAAFAGIESYLVPNVGWRHYYKESENLPQVALNHFVGPLLDAANIVGTAVVAGVLATEVLGLKYPEGESLVWLAVASVKIGTNALNNYLMGQINRRLTVTDPVTASK